MLALLGLMWNRSSVLKHTYFDYILNEQCFVMETPKNELLKERPHLAHDFAKQIRYNKLRKLL